MHTIIEKENRDKIYQEIHNKKITSFICSRVTANDLYQLFFSKLKKLIEKREVERAKTLLNLNKSRVESSGDARAKANLLNNQGCLNLLEGQFRQAVENFIEALTYQPDNEIAKYNLAVTYLKIVDYDNCQRTLATLSYDFDKVKYTSIIIQLPKNYIKIDEEIKNMGDDLKSNSTILHTLALVFLQNKNYEKADYYLRQLLKSKEDLEDSHINREYQLLKEYLLFQDDNLAKNLTRVTNHSTDKIKLLFSLMQKEGEGILSSNGTLAEREATQKILLEEKDILLDITALLTIHLIGSDHFFANLSNKIAITPQTKELIENKILTLELENHGELIQTFKSDHLDWQNIQLADLENNIIFYKRIAAWVSKYCELLECENIDLGISIDEKKSLLERYDELTVETILTAKAHNLALYCDDLKLREIAWNEFGIGGFWTQIFLADQCAKKELSNIDYHDFSITLCLYNYHNTTVNNLMIIRALENAKFKIAEPFLSICKHIESVTLYDEDGIDNTIITLSTIWNLHIHLQLKREIITHIVSVVTKDKIAYMIIDKFIKILGYQKREQFEGLISLLKELK